MESGTTGDPDLLAHSDGLPRGIPSEEDSRGYNELKCVGDNSEGAEQEVEEVDLSPEFDFYEDLAGDKLRLLDCFTIYDADGRPVPPLALDGAKERGQRFVVFGTVVAPLTPDARAKLFSLDVRLKGRIPPCLPKSLQGGAPEPLPWVASLLPPPPAAKGGGGSKAGKSSTTKKSRSRPKASGKQTSKNDGGSGLDPGHMGGIEPEAGAAAGRAGGVPGVVGPGVDDEGMFGGSYSPSGKRKLAHKDGPASSTPASKKARKGGDKPTSDKTVETSGGTGASAASVSDRKDGLLLPAHQLLAGVGHSDVSRENGNPSELVPHKGFPPLAPATPSRPRDDPGGMMPQAKGGGGADGGGNASLSGPKKRKGGDSGAAAVSAGKKTKLPPSFSLAAFVGGLDGSETRGVQGAEFVGSSFRRGRKDGLLLYYVDKAPRDYPFEYESKAAGAASLDWSYMRKHLKVDAFCMETFRWYGAKVAEVSIERQQVKVHFNGWKSKFDEWMDWGSFRLAPCGSRSSAKREGEQASGPVKKESSTRCVLVPARRTARLRIEGVDDWCIDHSDPAHPVLWFISPNAWYKVAGAAWWDFVAPHPLYARVFEPARRGFASACLVARCLQSSPLASFATVARRVSQFSSGVFEAPEIIEHHEIVTATVVGMGTLSTKKARDSTGGEGGGGSGDDTPYGGTWLVSNGDKDQQPVSIEAKDTLFLKELRAKVQERMSRARRPASRPGARNASPRGAHPGEGNAPNASDRGNPLGSIEEGSGSLSPVPRRGEGGSGGKASGAGGSKISSGRGSVGGRGGSGGAGDVSSAQAEAAASAAQAAAIAKANAEKDRKEAEKRKKEEEREREKERRETERLRKEQEKERREQERDKEKAEKAMEKAERAMEKAMAKKAAMEKTLAKKAAMEKKAQEKAEEAAAKRSALEKKAQERVERQRQIVEEKERLRKAKEAERLAKLEAKRLEKEAKDRERAETQAREQARREADRKKARLAKRYPIPDEELWEEQRQLGRRLVPWPEAEKVPCPKGFPASAIGDVVNIWSCLQLFGPLVHLRRFSLAELMVALAHGALASDGQDLSEDGDGDGVSPDDESDEDDAESLMDVIPAPFHQSSVGEDINGSAAAELIANIHMRLLDFLAWDRTRALRCAPEGKQGAYWRSLLPQVSWATSGMGGTGSGASGLSGAAGVSNVGQQADSGGGTLGGGLSASGTWPTAFQSGDEEDFKGAPETTLPGLRDSRELLQASPHGWPELLRLVAMGREGILGGADSCGALLLASRANAAEEGDSMLKGLQRRALLRSRHLDPLGEVLRILRHVARLEEARGFLAPPLDLEVHPGSRDAEGGEGSVVSKEEVGSGSGSEEGDEGSDGGEEKDPARLLRRPLDIGSIVKRIESGWYDPEATAEPPFPSKSFGAGHSGVAYDMELMQQGWLEARGVDSIVYEQARTVLEEFLSLYETHVLEPLREVNKALRVRPRTAHTRSDCVRPGANIFLDRETMDDGAAVETGEDDEGDEEDMGDPLVMLQQMGSEEYVNWCPAARSRALAWLCDEVFSAGTINDLVKKILEAKEVVDRKDREVKAAVRQKIREDEAREASGSNPGSASMRRGTEADMISARIGSEGPEMKTARQLSSVKVRLRPLGTDRNRRRYWLLAKGEDHRLFTELVGKWGCYARVSQIKALHKWLDRRGIRERTLKAGVREHLITNLGMSAEELDPPDRPSGYRRSRDEDDTDGEDDEEPQYIGEPAEVAREKERERNAGREGLRLCGFEAEDQRFVLERLCQPFAVDMSTLRHARLAFEPRTRGFVLRDVAVRLGPDGLEGVELDMSNGGVVVAGYPSSRDEAQNFGQDAGIQVGDVVVSVHNSMAEDAKSLLTELEGVAAEGETAKIVVMKVLTLVQLTDTNGEPAAGALDYRAIDRLKGVLLEAETRLHHHYVIGTGWEGRACRGWRLGVAFAGQGLGKGWGHEALVPPSVWSRSGEDGNRAKPDDADGKSAELLPFGDEGPDLREEGAVELGPLTPEGGRLAVAELGRRVLQLEASVSKQDTVVDARWGQLGRRRKWRTFVGKAQTAAQLLAAWSAFGEVIDWQAARWCYSDLDRRSFLSLLPAHARNTIPEVGDTVLYFGDGHEISVESERKAGHDTAWGSDTPIPCAVIPSTVKSICYHQGGSTRRAKGAQPFASLELEPMEMGGAEIGHTELGLLPASEPFGTLNRLLKRAIKSMRETAGVEHFLSPVSRSIYPDYYEVITEPMDLTKLGKRCSACRYRSVEEFKHDLSLVASNCRLYCQDKFPTLPPAADAVVKVGMDTLEERELAAMLVKTAREGNRLEGLWNKHMSAAINASPELATMPGMQKLARQLGFSTGEEADDLEYDDDSDDSVRQPDTARIARQVFFDKLVGVQSPTRKADHRRRESSQGSPGKLSPPSKPASRHYSSNCKPSISSEKGKPAEASPGTRVSGKSRARSASLDSGKKGGMRHGVMVKTEESVDARGVGETRSGTLRVSMRLSNEMPEFVVKKSKYEEVMKTQWRSEMHIQMAFMDDPEEPPRIYEGSLVGVKPRDPKTGFMPWECMMVEWDDENGVNTVNPWEIEAVTAATASARRRAPAGGHG